MLRPLLQCVKRRIVQRDCNVTFRVPAETERPFVIYQEPFEK